VSNPPRRSLFVTGTDTDVGKTVVSTAVVRGLRARGLDVGAMKPAETGVDERGPLDAQALRAATGDADPLELVCPFQFALPAAPTVAASAEGRGGDPAEVRRVCARPGVRPDLVVVEGAGGLLVPLAGDVDMAGLAGALDLPVLVVARAALATINHSLLTVSELERQGLECVGVVVSHAGGVLSDADAANLGDLRRLLGDRLLGEIPPLPGEAPQADPALIDLDRLDAALTRS
jgi:dethiobiotin synthetase